MDSALITKGVRMLESMDHPTTMRVAKSITVAKYNGAVANFRRRAVTTQSSSSDARCGSAFSGSLEHPADDHRIRVRLPVGKHRALAFP